MSVYGYGPYGDGPYGGRGTGLDPVDCSDLTLSAEACTVLELTVDDIDGLFPGESVFPGEDAFPLEGLPSTGTLSPASEDDL